jgi:hypothetical protein
MQLNPSKSSQLLCRTVTVLDDKEKAEKMLVTAGSKPDLILRNKEVE